jgi:hypothetical protein
MKYFYILTLILGVIMAVLMQAVTIAIPRDAFVASVLSRSPDQWTITVDDALTNRLSNHDVKQDTVAALSKRAAFRGDIYTQSLWEGTALIILSVIGLIRERKIRKMNKMIEQSRPA